MTTEEKIVITDEELLAELKTMSYYEVSSNDVVKLEEPKEVPSNWWWNDDNLFGQRGMLDFFKVKNHLVVVDRSLFFGAEGRIRRYGKYSNYLRDSWDCGIATCNGMGIGATKYFFVPKKVLIERIKLKQKGKQNDN